MCDDGGVTRRLSILVALPVIALVAGCGQAKDAVTDAASSAASRVGDATAAEVRSQICASVQDGQISAQDKQVLSGLVAAAKSAGLPAEITTPVGEIARAGDQAPAESVTTLRKACG